LVALARRLHKKVPARRRSTRDKAPSAVAPAASRLEIASNTNLALPATAFFALDCFYRYLSLHLTARRSDSGRWTGHESNRQNDTLIDTF
jgi:hypothetical protein